jgi:hypothetical protein
MPARCNWRTAINQLQPGDYSLQDGRIVMLNVVSTEKALRIKRAAWSCCHQDGSYCGYGVLSNWRLAAWRQAPHRVLRLYEVKLWASFGIKARRQGLIVNVALA